MDNEKSTIVSERVSHDLIQKHYVELVEGMALEDTLVIDYLFSKNAITRSEMESLRSCPTEQRMVRKLLDMFLKKPLKMVQELAEALRENDQSHIVDNLLNPSALQCKTQEERGEGDGCQRPSITSEAPTAAYTVFVPTISIREAHQADRKDFYTIAGLITNKTKVESYQKRNGDQVHYFTITVCDNSDVTNIRVYQLRTFNLMRIKKSYRFKNVVRRAELFLFVLSSSLCQIGQVSVPRPLMKRASTLSQCLKDNTPRKLVAALEAMSRSCIKGKIVKVSPEKFVKNGDLMRHIALIDSQDGTPVKVAVFGENAKGPYREGDCISITHVYVWKGPGQTASLSTTKESTVRFVASQKELAQLEKLTCPHMTKDPDFEESETVDIIILGVEGAGLFKPKEKSGQEATKMTYGDTDRPKDPSFGDWACWVKLIVVQRGTETRQTMFKSEMDKIFKLEDLEFYENAEGLVDKICEQLPLHGKAQVKDDKILISSTKGVWKKAKS